ncbi:MAG TPA: beta-propeller domain-containing protein [Rhizomicrobium sp.]
MGASQNRPWINAAIAATFAFVGTLSAVTFARAPESPQASGTGTLVAFKSDDDLRQFLKKHVSTRRAMMKADMAASPMAEQVATVAAAPPPASSGITNNQEANVDEGDIVKMHGQTMVILRRGRLFTVSLASGGMHPVDRINAYAPGVNARDDWYDEMLIAGDRILVVGYSYARGGTEINRFHIDDDGRLAFEDSYQLRSNDYYSSRNYASRLIGNQLIFYSPLYLSPWGGDPLDSLPALRRWTGDSRAGFRRIASANQVYIPASLRDSDAPIEALHTVTSCDVAAAILDCTATSVLGPNSRSFYVSGHAVYVWVASWQGEQARHAPSAMVYRLPLDGARPQAVGAFGVPTDQFSFREDPASQALDVLVRANGGGDAMWNPEFSDGAVALAHIPRDAFGDGNSVVSHYRELPRPSRDVYDFHNRFVGDYVLYGAGNGWGTPQSQQQELVAVPLDGGAITQLPLDHAIDRIEAMGRDAVVIGSGDDKLVFTAIELSAGRKPLVGDRYALEASQAETRSHAFFFSRDPWSEWSNNGVLGLPVARPARTAYHQLFENSAAMIYLRRQDHRFMPLGELAASEEGIVDDRCTASCVDWYGNARPIFLGDRTFALLGYELVEGRRGRDAIHELRRVSFAPGRERVMRPMPS